MTVAASEPRTRGGALVLFIVLGAATVYGPASTDANLPALPSVARDFHVTTAGTQLTLTSMLIGLALGQIVFGALSDVYGRRRPFFAGLSLYAIVTLLCAAAPSIEALIAFRFLQGVTAAAGIVTTRAIIRDLYEGSQAAQYLSRLMLLIGLAPMLAPSIGAQILRVSSWRGIFVALAGFVLLLLLATIFLIPETLPPSRRLESGISSMANGFRALIRSRRFMVYCAAIGLATATVVAYVAGGPFILEDRYGLSAQQFGLVFTINGGAMVACSQLNVRLLRRRRLGVVLLAAAVVNVVAGLVLVAASVETSLGLTTVLICFFVLFGSWGIIPANTLALALSAQHDKAGSASALLGLSQYGVGALVAPLVGLGGGQSLLALAVVIETCGLGALGLLAVAARMTPDPRSAQPLSPVVGLLPVVGGE